MTTVHVDPLAWVEVLAQEQAAGFASLELLTAVDRGAEVEVVVVLRNVDGDCRLLATRIPADEPALASAASVFPSAGWPEREAAEMFGIVFDGSPDPRPLLLGWADEQSQANAAPLRKASPLPERTTRPWPGAARESSGRRERRPQLPPGVRDEWQGAEGAP